MVKLEIVYQQSTGELTRIELELESPLTVAQVLEQSGIFQQHPETRTLNFGIFGQQVEPEHQVRHGDRIEIYRPLTVNPMDKRRQRASSKK